MPSLIRVTVLKMCAADLLRSVMNLAVVTTKDIEVDLVRITEKLDNISVEKMSVLAVKEVTPIIRAIAKI